jgi:hypothetical protein
MRLLRDVVCGRARGPAAAVLALAAVTALAGCSRFDAALGQRQAIVTFHSGTQVAQRLTVRSACAKVPSVKAPPLPADLNSPYALRPLIYRIDHATDAQVAMLEKCLAKFPSVAGVTLQDSTDTGSLFFIPNGPWYHSLITDPRSSGRPSPHCRFHV